MMNVIDGYHFYKIRQETMQQSFQDDIELYKISFLSNPQINHCLQLYTLDCDISSVKIEFQQRNYPTVSKYITLEQEKASLIF